MDGTGEHHPERGLTWLRRPIIICSPSYADFRYRADIAMLLELGYTLRRESTYGRNVDR
jgi:hypothetical protein